MEEGKKGRKNREIAEKGEKYKYRNDTILSQDRMCVEATRVFQKLLSQIGNIFP